MPRVGIYRNLTRDCWSLCHLSRTGASRGKLIRHADTVTAAGCTSHVSETSRQRVVRVGHREVHAWIIGDVVSVDEPVKTTGDRVTYRPFDGPDFIYADSGETFTGCEKLVFDNNGRVYSC